MQIPARSTPTCEGFPSRQTHTVLPPTPTPQRSTARSPPASREPLAPAARDHDARAALRLHLPTYSVRRARTPRFLIWVASGGGGESKGRVPSRVVEFRTWDGLAHLTSAKRGGHRWRGRRREYAFARSVDGVRGTRAWETFRQKPAEARRCGVFQNWRHARLIPVPPVFGAPVWDRRRGTAEDAKTRRLLSSTRPNNTHIRG